MTENNTPRAIPLQPVASSQLHAIGHDPASDTLAIQFKAKDGSPGSLYHYRNFSAADFAEFQAAESLGSHFKRTIKSNPEKYPYQRVQVSA